MSSLDDSNGDIGELRQPPKQQGAESKEDMDFKESSNYKRLKLLIEENVGQADSIVGSISAAQNSVETSITNLEQSYANLAMELKIKVEKQQRDQLE